MHSCSGREPQSALTHVFKRFHFAATRRVLGATADVCFSRRVNVEDGVDLCARAFQLTLSYHDFEFSPCRVPREENRGVLAVHSGFGVGVRS